MHTLHFSIQIDAPPQTVWDTMLGPATYRDWAAAFCEGSYFEGSWIQGADIRFLGPNGDGMLSIVAESRPYEFVSLKHIGFFKDGVADTDSESVRKWAPAYENYTLVPSGAGTGLHIDIDVTPDFEDYMLETWPKALDRLKAISEGR